MCEVRERRLQSTVILREENLRYPVSVINLAVTGARTDIRYIPKYLMFSLVNFSCCTVER